MYFTRTYRPILIRWTYMYKITSDIVLYGALCVGDFDALCFKFTSCVYGVVQFVLKS